MEWDGWRDTEREGEVRIECRRGTKRRMGKADGGSVGEVLMLYFTMCVFQVYNTVMSHGGEDTFEALLKVRVNSSLNLSSPLHVK